MNKFKSFILIIYYYILYLITPKSKLKVLYYALYEYLYYYPYIGMCSSIKSGLYRVYDIDNEIEYRSLKQYFPEFTPYVAAKLFNGNSSTQYWWPRENIKDRYNYFKWIIKIYKNKKE